MIRSNGIWFWQRKSVADLIFKMQSIDWYHTEPIKRTAIVADFKRFIPCTDCGRNFDSVCLNFDHIKREDKVMNLTDAVRGSRSKYFEEIVKCELVCLNCHARRELKRDNEPASAELIKKMLRRKGEA